MPEKDTSIRIRNKTKSTAKKKDKIRNPLLILVAFNRLVRQRVSAAFAIKRTSL